MTEKKHYYYKPVPTEAELKLAEAKTLAFCEGYADARAQCVRAAYESAERFGISRDDFAREFVAKLNALKQGYVE